MAGRFGVSRAGRAPVAPSVGFSATAKSFTSISVGGRIWTCAAEDAFIARTWAVGAGDNTLVEHPASGFTITVSTSGSVTTVTGTKAVTGGTLTVIATYTVDSTDQSISFSVSGSITGSLALDGVEWPRMALEAPADPTDIYAVWPIWAGYVRRSPHLATTTAIASMPSMSQWFGMMDGAGKATLYFYRKYVNDNVLPYLDVRVTGGHASATSTTVGFRHMGTGNRTVANSLPATSLRYTLQVRTIETTGDGRTGFQDCVNYYQQWAFETSTITGLFKRSWMPTAKWFYASTGAFAAKMAAVRVVTRTGDTAAGVVTGTTTPNYTFYQTEATRLKGNWGSDGTDIVQIPNMWHANVFDTNVPAHTPQRGSPALNNYITAVQALGIRVAPYVNWQYWETTLLAGTYKITDFDLSGLGLTHFGDIRGGMCRSVGTTSVQTAAIGSGIGAYCSWDFSRYLNAGTDAGLANTAYNFGSVNTAPVSSYLFALAALSLLDMAPDPDSFYIDQASGTNGSTFQDWGTSSPFGGGNHGRFVYGKNKEYKTTIDTSRAGGVGAFSEAPDETMLNVFEFTAHASALSYSFFGTSMAIARRCYGDYQRAFDLAPQITDVASGSGQWLLNMQHILVNWLRNGVVSYLNDVTPAATSTFTATTDYTNSSAASYLVAKLINLIHASLTYTDSYVTKGMLLRPSKTSWELTAADAYQAVNSYVVNALQDEASGTMPHGVYKHYLLNRWGVVAVCALSNTPASFRMVFDCKEYGMPAAEKILYKNNLDGTTTELTRFRNALDYTVLITGPAVALFEIVPS